MASQDAIAISRYYEQHLTRPPEAVAEDLESYAQLLLKWQRIQNLVSRETVQTLWPRHMADSLQVARLIPDKRVNAIDIGSGGGFPALPLAIARKGLLQTTLIEANARKASFLRTVVRELQLDVVIVQKRAEEIEAADMAVPDVITARALAPLDLLCTWAAPFFGPETRALFHKGREHVDEIAETRARWQFDVIEHASDTDDKGVVLEISNLRLKTK